jgi:hypothetical protein
VTDASGSVSVYIVIAHRSTVKGARRSGNSVSRSSRNARIVSLRHYRNETIRALRGARSRPEYNQVPEISCAANVAGTLLCLSHTSI